MAMGRSIESFTWQRKERRIMNKEDILQLAKQLSKEMSKADRAIMLESFITEFANHFNSTEYQKWTGSQKFNHIMKCAEIILEFRGEQVDSSELN